MALSFFASVVCAGAGASVKSFEELQDPETLFGHRVYSTKPLLDGLSTGEVGTEFEFRANPPRSLFRLPLDMPDCRWVMRFRPEGVLGDWPAEEEEAIRRYQSERQAERSGVTGMESIRGKAVVDCGQVEVVWRIGEKLGFRIHQTAEATRLVRGLDPLMFFE